MKTIGHGKVKSFLEKLQKADKAGGSFAFVGKRGIGKKLLALEFAKGLLCKKNVPFGCGECKSCKQVNEFIAKLQQGEYDNFALYTEDDRGKKHFSFLVSENPDLAVAIPDGNQIKIDQIRDLQEWIALKPTGRFKVAIIDQAEKMNIQAQNALLKTLEEPPSYAVFILILENRGQVLPTILSRCRIIEFGKLKPQEVDEILKQQKVEIPDNLKEILRREGSLEFLNLLTEEEEIADILTRITKSEGLTYSWIVDISDKTDRWETSRKENLLRLIEKQLINLLLEEKINTETFERCQKIINETLRGLKWGVKFKLALENLLINLKRNQTFSSTKSPYRT
jgi:DNA polymerase-3 subunit delta'